MRMAMGILVLFAMLSACDRGGSSGGDDSESDRICAPGSTQACLCAGGVDGARTCDAAGTSWGNCDCGSSDTDTDTSSDSQDTSSETTDTETVDTASDSQDTDTALDTDFDDPNCPDGQWTACYGDDVWCVDVDKEPITPVEDCEDPYHCVPGTPAACDCAPEWTTRCYGGDVWWYDSCGDVDHRRTVCDTGCSVCTELSDTEAACVPLELESKQQCASGDVYWFDSCNNPNTRVDDCAADETCVNDGAAAAFCRVSSCIGQADFTRCAVKTMPDRSYDICIRGTCQSPGCDTAACNAPGPHFTIPDTNQRDCYNATTSIICPTSGQSFFGQDAQYGWDLTHAATERYTRNTATPDQPVVTDNVTTLVWQGCCGGLQGNDCTEDDPAVTGTGVEGFTWADALAHCDSLDWGGFTDWHLPDEFELDSIVDYGWGYPSIDIEAFPGTTDRCFWTSSSRADHTYYKWYVHFGLGGSDWWGEEEVCLARCVRGGPSGAARFTRSTTTANQPVVTDNVTTLVWQGCAAGLQGNDCTEDVPAVTGTDEAKFTWADALVYCENLTWGGTSDWRLPSVKELKSIVDNSRSGPAPTIDITAFPATPNFDFWTSSSRALGAGSAWLGRFYGGYSPGYELKTNTFIYTRCVRGGP